MAQVRLVMPRVPSAFFALRGARNSQPARNGTVEPGEPWARPVREEFSKRFKPADRVREGDVAGRRPRTVEHAPGGIGVRLREVRDSDLPTFFEHQRDPVANHMAAFTSKDPTDRDAFDAHWSRILGDDAITPKTILVDGDVAGHIASFERDGQPEVTYWIGREYWGKGVATEALYRFLRDVEVRPLRARVAKDNIASIRVLEKCGFTMHGRAKGFANARGEEVEEFVMELK